jgi:hypothetical protein
MSQILCLKDYFDWILSIFSARMFKFFELKISSIDDFKNIIIDSMDEELFSPRIVFSI